MTCIFKLPLRATVDYFASWHRLVRIDGFAERSSRIRRIGTRPH